MGGSGLNSSGSEQRQIQGSCERGNETLGSETLGSETLCSEPCDLRLHEFVKNDSAYWS